MQYVAFGRKMQTSLDMLHADPYLFGLVSGKANGITDEFLFTIQLDAENAVSIRECAGKINIYTYPPHYRARPPAEKENDFSSVLVWRRKNGLLLAELTRTR